MKSLHQRRSDAESNEPNRALRIQNFVWHPRVRVTSASTESSVARSERGNGRIGYLWTRVSGMDIEVSTVQSLAGRGLTSRGKPRCYHEHGFGCEISPTRCNNCVFILRNGFTLHVSGDNLTHHQEYIYCIWPQVSRLT